MAFKGLQIYPFETEKPIIFYAFLGFFSTVSGLLNPLKTTSL